MWFVFIDDETLNSLFVLLQGLFSVGSELELWPAYLLTCHTNFRKDHVSSVVIQILYFLSETRLLAANQYRTWRFLNLPNPLFKFLNNFFICYFIIGSYCLLFSCSALANCVCICIVFNVLRIRKSLCQGGMVIAD